MKIKILAVILALVAAISAVTYMITRKPAYDEVPTDEVRPFTLETSGYSRKIAVAGANGEIYLPTDREGLFYTASLDNNIGFYKYDGMNFVPAGYEVKTTNVKLTASGVSVPVKISYINADGLTVGYGVFTSAMDSNVKIYPYAFVKIARKPAGYGSGYLLLADFDKENFFKAEKTYSEIYSYEIGQASVSTSLSQNTRLVDINGTFRQDWSMLTDEFISAMGNGKYFMSSRYYTAEETGERTDIMVFSNAYRPSVVAKDILGTWFVNDENGMHYLKASDGGFKCVVSKGDKTKETASFSGSYDRYLRNGNYIVCKDTGVMTNLLTGEEKNLTGISINDAVLFSVNKDGTRAVFAFSAQDSQGKEQKLIYYSDDKNQTASFKEPLLWEEHSGFIWLDGRTVMSVRAITSDGAQTGSVIYKFG